MSGDRPDWARDGADWPNRALSRFVDAGGLRWHVQESAGVGPSVLLIHGTGAATHSWAPLIQEAGAEWRMLAMDLPGHGFTRTPPLHRLGLEAMARDVGALLSATGFAPDLVVAHSAGGAVALRMAIDGAIRPRRMLLVNPALAPFRGLAAAFVPFLSRMIWAAPFSATCAARLAASPGMVERLLSATGSRIGAEGVACYRRLFTRAGHAEGAFGMMAQWDLSGLAEDLARVPVPVTFLIGLRDGYVPPSSVRRMAAEVPGAEVVEMEGLGHLLHEEAPGRVLDLMAAEMAGA